MCIKMGDTHIMWCKILLFLVLISGVILDTCEKHKNNCGACITDPSVCVWCAMRQFNGTRCISDKAYTEDWCRGAVQNPKVSAKLTDAIEFSSDLGRVVQITPQRYTLNLRPGVPVNFTFSYKPASDYPVDLYFLFDNSPSMDTALADVMKQSESIYNTMYNLTKNIQLGVGYFVDKNTFPYTDKLDKNTTYSFRNQLPLQNDPLVFKNIINNTIFGYNVDLPEGGLDALSQVLICGPDRIGWRNESRKLIMFLTNGPYHVAGDGMTAGIHTPYDGKCYTNNAGVYTNELEMDYPSVSMINKLATDEEIIIVFAVHADIQPLYSHLSEYISGSKIETLDGSQIAKIVTDIYESIARKIKLKERVEPDLRGIFKIIFDPDCTNTGYNNGVCSVKKGEDKTFTATITASEYIGYDSTSVDILIEGIKEKLTLDINFIKDCECESAAVPNSPECNLGGTLECGVCECNDNRYGLNCACVKNSVSYVNDNSTCIQPGDGKVCSGHGSCICGNCVCRKGSPYEGKYCQYNKDNCPRNNNIVCNGNGKCDNEQCICNEGWQGPACECPTSTTLCLGADGRECNGMGRCVCGGCACDPVADWDARDRQDPHCAFLPCQDCHKPQCDRLLTCALCFHSRQECPQCNYVKASVSDYIVTSTNISWNICPDLRINIGCYTRYMYRYMEDKYLIEMVVQAQEDCQESYYKFGGIALATLIMLGIMTVMLWKWITHARDRREYERFLRDHAADLDQTCENPCFKPPSTTINNPIFRKNSVDFTN